MPGTKRRSINKSKVLCAQCKTQVMESEDSMQCDVCEKTLHTLCTKLDKKQIEKLIKNTSLEFKCHFCAPVDNVSVATELGEINTKLNQLDEIKETMTFMAAQYDSILKGVAKNKKIIDGLKKENKNLRDEVKSVKASIKFLNDARVKNDCIISGVKTADNVKAIDVVLEIANKAGAEICEDEIDDAYFLNKNNKGNDKKSIVVKFSNNKSKRVFMNEKPKLKQVEDLKAVYINDFLSRETVQVLNYAKSLKSIGYKYIFSRGCNIYAKKDENGRQICLRSMDDVDKILVMAVGGTSKQNRNRDEDSSDDDDDNDDDGSFRSPN